MKSHPVHTHWSIQHHSDVIMSTIASQIISLTVVYSSVYSGADHRKHQSSALLVFVRGIHRWPVKSHKRASNTENVSIWWLHDNMVLMHDERYAIYYLLDRYRFHNYPTHYRIWTKRIVQFPDQWERSCQNAVLKHITTDGKWMF